MIIGITAEYNPFHNGHKFQIEQIRKLYPDATIAAIMSGSFTQRGNVSVIDKWIRAKIAVINGVDIVFELPMIYVNRSAEFFASGSLNLMHQLQFNAFAFGAECDNLQTLQNIADEFKSNSVQNQIHSKILAGNSYSNATNINQQLNQPNNILAIEYLKANKNLQPILIHRVQSSHQDNQLKNCISSSNSIRLELQKSQPNWYKISSATVPETFEELKKSHEDLPNIERLFRPLIMKVLSMSKSELQQILGMNEGLENRLMNKLNQVKSYQELINSMITRRYTKNRIARLLLNTLLNITTKTVNQSVNYARVLSFNDKGRKLLHKLKNSTQIPIIIKIPEYRAIISTDINATNLWSLTKSNVQLQLDFLKSPVYVK